MQSLEGFYNPEATQFALEGIPPLEGRVTQSGRETRVETIVSRGEEAAIAFNEFMFGKEADEVAMLHASVDEVEPTSFREAWDHPEVIQRHKWREAIRKEFHGMNQRKVWRKIKRRDIPPDRRCVKHKWVFKIKQNGTFQARLVACGYSQVAGVDFSENFAPVIIDVTWRILLIVMLTLGLEGKLIDIEVAFLHGDLEEDIYMDCPEGMEDAQPDECLKLEHTIYGLVQSAR